MTRARPAGAMPPALLGAAILAAMAGCEERVVYNNPMLAGLPGAETSMTITGPAGAGPDPTVVRGKLRRTDESGNITLVARAPRHLMKHIYDTVFNNEPRLFLDQVLSKVTKDEYDARGVDEMEAFNTLREHREDIHALFNAMPRGEMTPGVFLQPLGGRVHRLCVYGLAARDLRWNGFDMVMEDGNWKLRWFVSNQK